MSQEVRLEDLSPEERVSVLADRVTGLLAAAEELENLLKESKERSIFLNKTAREAKSSLQAVQNKNQAMQGHIEDLQQQIRELNERLESASRPEKKKASKAVTVPGEVDSDEST